MSLHDFQSTGILGSTGALKPLDLATLRNVAAPSLLRQMTDHWAVGTNSGAGNGMTGINGNVLAANATAGTIGANFITTATGNGNGYKCAAAALDDTLECTHLAMVWRPSSASATVIYTNSLNTVNPSGGGSGVGVSTVSTFNRLQDYTRGFYQSIRNPTDAAFPAEIPVNAPFLYGMSIRKSANTLMRRLMIVAPGLVLYGKNNNWPGEGLTKVVAPPGRGFSIGSTDLNVEYSTAIKFGQAAYLANYGMTEGEMRGALFAMREIAVLRQSVTGL